MQRTSINIVYQAYFLLLNQCSISNPFKEPRKLIRILCQSLRSYLRYVRLICRLAPWVPVAPRSICFWVCRIMQIFLRHSAKHPTENHQWWWERPPRSATPPAAPTRRGKNGFHQRRQHDGVVSNLLLCSLSSLYLFSSFSSWILRPKLRRSCWLWWLNYR